MPIIIFFSLFVSVLGGLCAAQNLTPYNFTLAAWNTTGPNLNSTGVPLVLGWHGSTHAAQSHLTSTHASYPYDDYPALGLVDGTLRAYTKDGGWRTNASEVQSGGPLIWVTTEFMGTVSQIYSAVTNTTDQSSLLAARGSCDLWSLCSFPNFNQTSIVYNASNTSDDYDPQSCYSVRINIIPTS